MQTWKTRFRRIAAMVCALALCASLLPMSAFAAGDTVTVNFDRNINQALNQNIDDACPELLISYEQNGELVSTTYDFSSSIELPKDTMITVEANINDGFYLWYWYSPIFITPGNDCYTIADNGTSYYETSGPAEGQHGRVAFSSKMQFEISAWVTENALITLYMTDGNHIDDHKITYLANDGTENTAEQHFYRSSRGTYGTRLLGCMFTREGYEFTGWNTSPDGSGTAYDAYTVYGYEIGENDLTLYAQWKMIDSGDEDPTAPTVDEIKNLIGEDGIETYCTTLVESHGSVFTGLLGEEGTDYEINYTAGETTATVEIQPTIYAKNMDQHIGTNSHVTVVEGSDHIIELAYVEGEWTLVGEKPAAQIHVTCDGSVTPPTDPELPDDDNLKDLLNGKISIICTTNTEHDAITSGLLGDRDTDYTVTQNGNTATVTIKADKYVAAMDDRYSGSEHEFVEAGSDRSIGLTYDATNGWTVDADDTATIKVKCDAGTTPGTEEPEKPTPDVVDKLNLKGVALVACQNTSAGHKMGTYDLLKDSYTIGEVYLADDNTYKVNLTLIPDKYVSAYDNDTGAVHTGANAGVITLKYADGAWQCDGNGMVMFQVKCSTVTVPGDGGNNNDTPKDEHPDIAEGIANGTWGGTPTPTPAASATSTIPQTSDSMPIGLLAGTAAIAAAAIALLLVLRKRRQQ